MNAITHRSTAVFGSLVLVLAAALTGCATTGGAVSANGAATSSTVHALAVDATVPTGAVICAGGHASRFPQREEIGRVCNHSPVLQAIY